MQHFTCTCMVAFVKKSTKTCHTLCTARHWVRGEHDGCMMDRCIFLALATQPSGIAETILLPHLIVNGQQTACILTLGVCVVHEVQVFAGIVAWAPKFISGSAACCFSSCRRFLQCFLSQFVCDSGVGAPACLRCSLEPSILHGKGEAAVDNQSLPSHWRVSGNQTHYIRHLSPEEHAPSKV